MISQEAIDRGIRIRRAENGAWSTIETRVALIAAERGLTEKQLAKFYVSRRKNCKPRFDYWAFAKAQDISTSDIKRCGWVVPRLAAVLATRWSTGEAARSVAIGIVPPLKHRYLPGVV